MKHVPQDALKRAAELSAPTLKGWTSDTLARLGIGLDSKGQWLIPTASGVLLYRDDGRKPKMVAPAGATRELWPAPEDVAGDVLYVVEGEPDAISMREIGLSAVAIPGGAKVSDEWAQRLAHDPDGNERSAVVVIADCDTTGRKAARDRAAKIAEHCVAYTGELDANKSGGYDVGDLLRDTLEYDAETGRDAARWRIENLTRERIQPSAELDPPSDGAAVLRALLGALPVDVHAATLDPLAPLPGAPFLLPSSTALLAGPEGAGKSQVAQIIAYDTARQGGRVLYLGGEVTHAEFIARARRIAETRDGEVTDDAATIWRERVAFADPGDVLPVLWRHLPAWQVVCAEYALIVLDAVSDAGAALELKFARDNDEWATFFQGFVKPCQGRVALLMLDNIGHNEDAKTRAIGASAKGHKVDIRLSARRRDNPLSLVITCEKVRGTRAPFRRGAKWVAYEAGCNSAVAFDDRQREREKAARDGADLAGIVVAALRTTSPLGLGKLVEVLRGEGVKGRNDDLRAALKAMVADPDVPIQDTGGKGLRLAPEFERLPMPQPMPRPHAHAPYTDGGMGRSDRLDSTDSQRRIDGHAQNVESAYTESAPDHERGDLP